MYQPCVQAAGPRSGPAPHETVQIWPAGGREEDSLEGVAVTMMNVKRQMFYWCSASLSPPHLLPLDLLGGEGSFLVHIQRLRPQHAVPSLGWGGRRRLAAGFLGHTRRLAIAPE